MNNLTISQKVYLAALLAVAGACLGLEIGVPIYEYNYGRSALTVLLAHLATVLLLAGLGVAVIGWVLQSMGILPVVRRDPQPATSLGRVVSPVGGLRNLAIWIVIAMVLVVFFNLLQGTGGGGKKSPDLAPTPMPDLVSVVINWFPMLLIFGVWIYFFRQMKGRQGDNTNKPNDP
jgi:branched-subunit amino acid ABC-type transport system permease component